MSNRSRSIFQSFATRRFNPRFIVTALVTVCLLVCVIVVVHRLQQPRIAKFLKTTADQHYQAGRLDDAIRYQRLYSRLNPDDEAFVQLGLWLAEVANPMADFEAFSKLTQALRRDEDRLDVRRAMLEVSIRRRLAKDALTHAKILAATNADSLTWQRIADAYLMNNMPEPGLAAYREAVITNPHNLVAQRKYIEHLFRQTKDIKVVEQAIDDLLQTNERSADALLVAHVLRRDLSMSGAEALLTEARRQAPKNLEVLLMAIGNALASNPGRAGELLDEAANISPDDPRILRISGRYHQTLGLIDKARDALNRGFELSNRSDASFAWRLAEIEIESGNWLNLVPYFDVIRRDPRYRSAEQFLRGRLAQLRGAPDEALDEYRQGKRILAVSTFGYVPDDGMEILFRLELGIAGASFQAGVAKNAIVAAKNALLLSPDSVVAQMTLAGLYFETRQFGLAAETWKKVKSNTFSPSTAAFEYARSLLYRELSKPVQRRDLKEYQDAYSDAMARTPDLPDLVLLRADEEKRTGRISQALTTVTAAAQANPTNVAVAHSLLSLLVLEGKPETASSFGRRLEDRFGVSISSRLALARTELRRGKVDQASQLLDAFAASAPPGPAAVAARFQAHCHWVNGHFAKAATLLEKAVENDPMAWSDLIEMYTEQGRYHDAWLVASKLADGRRDVMPLWHWADARLAIIAAQDRPELAQSTVKSHAAELQQLAPYWWGTSEINAWSAELAGDPDRALEHYRDALLGGPAYTSTRRRSVWLFARQGRLAEFQEIEMQLRGQVWPQDADKLLEVEKSLLEHPSGDALAQAESLVKDASTQQRGLLGLWYAKLLGRAGRYRDAEAVLRKLVEEGISLEGPDEPQRALSRLAAAMQVVKSGAYLDRLATELPQDRRELRLASAALAFNDETRASQHLLNIPADTFSPIDARLVVMFSRVRKRGELVPLMNRLLERFPARQLAFE